MAVEKIVCPACRAEISADGETVFRESTRLGKAQELSKDLASANKRIDELTTKIESLTKAPEAKKKGWADEFFSD